MDLSSELAEALRELQRRFEEINPCLRRYLWTGEGQPKKYGKFHERFQRVQSYLKIRYRSPHQLRHTFASVLLTAGKSITYVSAQLGDNPLTVFKTYAQVKRTEGSKSWTKKGVSR